MPRSRCGPNMLSWLSVLFHMDLCAQNNQVREAALAVCGSSKFGLTVCCAYVPGMSAALAQTYAWPHKDDIPRASNNVSLCCRRRVTPASTGPSNQQAQLMPLTSVLAGEAVPAVEPAEVIPSLPAAPLAGEPAAASFKVTPATDPATGGLPPGLHIRDSQDSRAAPVALQRCCL